MTTIRRLIPPMIAGSALLVGATACGDKFLQVTNPNVIDAATVNAAASAAALANTTQQNFATELGMTAMFESHFTGETYIIETSSSQNEFGKREVSVDNGTLNGRWAGLELAASSGKILLDLTLPNAASNVNVARAAAFRAYAILYIAIDFCSGTLSSGPELSTTQLLDSAIVWFTRAIDAGTANATADGSNLARAALVGRARAKLQKGDKTGALADANLVPAGFNFNLTFQDDLTNRARLSNTMWRFTVDRGTISVPPPTPRSPEVAPTATPNATSTAKSVSPFMSAPR